MLHYSIQSGDRLGGRLGDMTASLEDAMGRSATIIGSTLATFLLFTTQAWAADEEGKPSNSKKSEGVAQGGSASAGNQTNKPSKKASNSKKSQGSEKAPGGEPSRPASSY
jgi:hypothetical protein